MAKKITDKVDALLQADVRLVEGARTSLRAGKRSVVLIGQNGKITKADLQTMMIDKEAA